MGYLETDEVKNLLANGDKSVAKGINRHFKIVGQGVRVDGYTFNGVYFKTLKAAKAARDAAVQS